MKISVELLPLFDKVIQVASYQCAVLRVGMYHDYR